MTGLCVALVGGALLATIPAERFSLSWTHSVEKTEWREDWRIDGGRLVLARAWIKSTGAGMEPPDGARLEDGWWTWTPALAPQPRMILAASDHTADHTLCAAGSCRLLHAWFDRPVHDPVELRACP
ncbi:DUF1850 domain-containing protein [Azospirillum sp.]|uniref:DUF1850 domain-containing protein n=1 Tax=Azospirillum sp. TaxID=34012 RepID=UPI002D3AE9DE|nr:DUF1850 domain-containing protein [Azospirillum sp.]HYD65244.1 DUF1850 domain-containing protein [Azospirillum sp.]